MPLELGRVVFQKVCCNLNSKCYRFTSQHASVNHATTIMQTFVANSTVCSEQI